MKNAFDGLVSRQGSVEEESLSLKDISRENSKLKIKEEKNRGVRGAVQGS